MSTDIHDKRACAVDGCKKPRLGHDRHCGMHRSRYAKTGDVGPVGTVRLPPEQRFWSRVTKTEGCWLWTGAVNRRGYGRVDAMQEYLAHRISYRLCVGPIPAGAIVLHSCDNPPCVNPDHLRVGTNGDNAADMMGRDRHPNPIPQSEVVKILEMREQGTPYSEISRATGRKVRTLIALVSRRRKQGFKRWGSDVQQ